jgi:hypothetical protein
LQNSPFLNLAAAVEVLAELLHCLYQQLPPALVWADMVTLRCLLENDLQVLPVVEGVQYGLDCSIEVRIPAGLLHALCHG